MRFAVLPILVLILVATVNPAGAVGFDLGIAVGAQLNGDISDVNLDPDDGFSLGLELMFEIPIVKLGVGYEYGFPRDSSGAVSDIEHHLLYGVGRVHFLGPAFFMARVGYASVSAKTPDLSGSNESLSWSVGVGVKISKFKIEAMYNDFDISIDDTGGSTSYTNYTARLIYSF
jgi:hypothetical protein